MKQRWLKLVLSLSNQIYQKKQAIIKKEGAGLLSAVFSLFFLELFLAIISLPLYFSLRTNKVVAFFQEQGAYQKVAYDYSLRRVLTLTGVAIIFFIWLLKFLLIWFTPTVMGPLRLYNVSSLEPATIEELNLIEDETNIYRAEISNDLEKPVVSGVEKISGGDYLFHGEGAPLTTLVLFLSDKQTAVYYVDVNENGFWTFRYDAGGLKLREGNHELVAFCYDSKTGRRSQLSNNQYFKVTRSNLDVLFANLDNILNYTIVIILSLGVLLTLLIF